MVGSSAHCFEPALQAGASRLLGMRRNALVTIHLHPAERRGARASREDRRPTAGLFAAACQAFRGEGI